LSTARFTQAIANRSVYIAKNSSIQIPIECRIRDQTLALKALLDSGATECFLNTNKVRELDLPKKKLNKPKEVRNVDGTLNVDGSITHETFLKVRLNGKEKTLRFYLANIGNEEAILGYPFLESLDPTINWGKATIEGTLKLSLPRKKRNCVPKWI